MPSRSKFKTQFVWSYSRNTSLYSSLLKFASVINSTVHMSLSCCQDFSPMYNLNSVRMIILMLYISILFIATKYIYINSAAHMSLSWCQGFLPMYCFLNYPIHEYHLNFSLSSFNRAYISQSSIHVDVKSNMEWTPHRDV